MGHLALAGGGLGGWQVSRLASHQDASRVGPDNSRGWASAGRAVSSPHGQDRAAESCRARWQGWVCVGGVWSASPELSVLAVLCGVPRETGCISFPWCQGTKGPTSPCCAAC